VRVLLKISVKQYKGVRSLGYEISSIPLRKLKAMDCLTVKRWYLETGFLVLEATV